jgi:hypothetical protein
VDFEIRLLVIFLVFLLGFLAQEELRPLLIVEVVYVFFIQEPEILR